MEGRIDTSRPQRQDAERLTVLYSFPHALGAPGIGWTAWNQANELVRAGHEVHIVAASIAIPVPGAASTRTTLTAFSRRIPHRVLGRDRALAYHDAVVSRIVRRGGIDVVHSWPRASVRTFRAAAQQGIASLREVPNTHTANAYEVVARETELLGLSTPRGASHTHDKRRLAIEEKEWATATALLVPSEPVARSFLERGFDPNRLLRHQYGCSVKVVRPPRGDRPFTAVFLGRGDPRKGLHYALRAWVASSASRHGRFLVYGHIEHEYGRYLAPLLDDPSVEVCGVTSDPMTVLANSDVLLLPSVEEGSALVTYEAQVAGCVPLVSVAAGAVLTNGVSGLMHEVGDVSTLSHQLDALSSQPDRLAQMQAAALARADDLSWAAAVRLQVKAYRRAMGMMADSPAR
ncbi:glycosyltransferase family 4 protein [Microbacterium sp.]|uniref:glycosyltransferase family 4 protein n=1 Tax=Microbacterium sp. TaxID=51671 RepID=UPI003C73B54D